MYFNLHLFYAYFQWNCYLAAAQLGQLSARPTTMLIYCCAADSSALTLNNCAFIWFNLWPLANGRRGGKYHGGVGADWVGSAMGRRLWLIARTKDEGPRTTPHVVSPNSVWLTRIGVIGLAAVRRIELPRIWKLGCTLKILKDFEVYLNSIKMFWISSTNFKSLKIEKFKFSKFQRKNTSYLWLVFFILLLFYNNISRHRIIYDFTS